MKYRFKHFKTLTSTNDLALEMARKGADEGWVISTDYQTRGRGRGKKKWTSPRGENLLFSLLLRPRIPANRAPFLTHLAALSVKEAITESFPMLRTRLKKPNDVMVNGKKISGILVESSTQGGKLDFAVVGIGLNVTAPMSNRLKRSISIFEATGKKIERSNIQKSILGIFKLKYTDFKHKEVKPDIIPV